MENLFLKLAEMSVTASYIAIAVILLRLPLKKAPKWIMSLLWALVALRLVCPITFESKLSLVPESAGIYDMSEDPAPVTDTEPLWDIEPIYPSAEPVLTESEPVAPTESEIPSIAPKVPAAPKAPQAPDAPTEAEKPLYLRVLTSVWLCGVALNASLRSDELPFAPRESQGVGAA